MKTNKEELIALMDYMVRHNESHNKELMDLAASLKEVDSVAYADVGKAIELFTKGNESLTLALKEMNKE